MYFYLCNKLIYVQCTFICAINLYMCNKLVYVQCTFICAINLYTCNILLYVLFTYRSAIHSISISQAGRQTLPMTMTVGMAGKRLANRS